MGPTWILSAPDGPHNGPMNLAIRDDRHLYRIMTVSLIPCRDWRRRYNFMNIVFKLITHNSSLSTRYIIAFGQIPGNLTDEMSALVQVMAWGHQVTRHYLNQCQARTLLRYGGTKPQHYIDVIMTVIMASQITSLTVVYSTVYSDADQRKHQSSASLAFVWGIHRDRWIPHTKGQLRGKCFHLMTSSWCVWVTHPTALTRWQPKENKLKQCQISWQRQTLYT